MNSEPSMNGATASSMTISGASRRHAVTFGRGACDHERVAVGDHVGDHVAQSAACGVYYDFGLVHSRVFAPDCRSKNVPNAAARKKKVAAGCAARIFFVYLQAKSGENTY